MKMATRIAQNTPVGVGCAYLTQGWLPKQDAAAVHAALEAGALHFDVAPQYGQGTAERVLGQALGSHRGEVILASKIGIGRPRVSSARLALRAVFGPLRKRLRQSNALARAQRPQTPKARTPTDFSLEFVRRSFGETLDALRTDHLDILHLHMVQAADFGDGLRAWLTDLRAAGTVRAIGLASEREEDEAIYADAGFDFDVLQYSWSVLDPRPAVATADRLCITHRGLMYALQPLVTRLRQDPAMAVRLSDATGADLVDTGVLARVLIGAGVAANPAGVTLVASHDPRRVADNVEAGLSPQWRMAGQALLHAMRENSCPGRVG